MLASGGGGGVLLMVAVAASIDIFSATNSSPWTAENFGGNEEKVASLREYVMHAIILSAATVGTGAYVEKSWYPIAGGVLACGYMVWLYERAVARGMASGSEGWQNG